MEKNVMKYPYRIIITSNGREIESVGAYHTEHQALKAIEDLSEESKRNVKFPVKLINKEKIEEVKYEYVLIKKREENDPLVSRIRNEYGEYVDNVSDNDKWLIIDRKECLREEKFWVYGFHPLTDRKDFSYIYNEMVRPKATTKGEFLNIKIFLNKLILTSNSNTDLITCKSKSDSIRLYNLLNETCINDKKIKWVCFSGDCNSTHLARERCIEEIMALTNWDKNKITRSKTKTNKTWVKNKKRDE